MRSQLVFDSTMRIANRYLLVMLASKATRKLHRPNSRIPDTTNHALAHLAGAELTVDLEAACKIEQLPPIRYVGKAVSPSLGARLKRSAA
jgi:hypothetical protein